MKSNLTEIMNKLMPELKEKGHIDIEELIDEVEKEFYLEGRFNKKKFLRKYYLQPRIENILNINKFFAYKKKGFVCLESANFNDFKTIIKHFENGIASRQMTLNKIREKEREHWEQQLKFTIIDNVVTGQEEEGPFIKKAEGI